MAIRNIRKLGDDILRKKCREVDNIDNKIITLIEDMKDTLKKSNGVGLAAPQVGILKRIIVIDVGEGVFELINPEITAASGSKKEVEGCLSVPNKWGIVERPEKVCVTSLNAKGERFDIIGEGLLAKALCHEIDHLDGIVFVDKVEEYVDLD